MSGTGARESRLLARDREFLCKRHVSSRNGVLALRSYMVESMVIGMPAFIYALASCYFTARPGRRKIQSQDSPGIPSRERRPEAEPPPRRPACREQPASRRDPDVWRPDAALPVIDNTVSVCIGYCNTCAVHRQRRPSSTQQIDKRQAITSHVCVRTMWLRCARARPVLPAHYLQCWRSSATKAHTHTHTPARPLPRDPLHTQRCS